MDFKYIITSLFCFFIIRLLRYEINNELYKKNNNRLINDKNNDTFINNKLKKVEIGKQTYCVVV